MNGMLKVIAQIVRRNAVEGAGAASVKGAYESAVPASLKKSK